MQKKHYRTCNLCEAMCGIEITVDEERIVSIRGDEHDEFSRGHICPKAVALQDIHNDPNRLKFPVKRTPDGWAQIGWNEAFDEVAAQIHAIQEEHGNSSVGVYLGNPYVHNYGSLLYAPGFLRALRTKNLFSATSVDQLAHHFTAYFLYGHQLLIPVPDIDHTGYFLILGGNPAVSNGSLMSAPDVVTRLKAIRSRNGKVVLIDPRRTETAAFADQHFFIRPGTDALLLLSMLQVIFSQNLMRKSHVDAFTDGMETVRKYAMEYPPEKTASVTGISPEEVRTLAGEFATSPSAVCYGRIGVSTQEFGGLCQWLIHLINIATGNLDRTGGSMFTLPAFDAITAPRWLYSAGHHARWRSRVRALAEFGGELPVAALAEEILTEGKGQIRAMITSAGNPVLSTPNGSQLDRAFSGLRFMASIDYYINETTKHANIILPPTASLEHDNYELAFHHLAIRNNAKYSPALFNGNNNTRHDWQIFSELESRLSRKSFLQRVGARLLYHLQPKGLLAVGLRIGPHRNLSLRKLKNAPHGVDLGPLQTCLPSRLCTANKRIQVANDLFIQDIDRLKQKFFSQTTNPSEFDLLLIGRRQLRSNNSWMHNYSRLMKGEEQCTLHMHPEDALRKGICDGDLVEASSRVGSIRIKARVTDTLMPGVVSIPHGWGHNQQGIQLDVARQHPGASINDLTDELSLDALCGTAAFNGTPVSVSPILAS